MKEWFKGKWKILAISFTLISVSIIPISLISLKFDITIVNPPDVSSIPNPIQISRCHASSNNITIHDYYKPGNVIDGKPETAWVENKPDYGINEWIKLEFDAEYDISGVEIINGFSRPNNDYSRYHKNARVKKIKIETSNGYQQTETLQDNNYGFQTINFNQLQKTSTISRLKRLI